MNHPESGIHVMCDGGKGKFRLSARTTEQKKKKKALKDD